MISGTATIKVELSFAELVRKHGDDWRLWGLHEARGCPALQNALTNADDSNHATRPDRTDYVRMRNGIWSEPEIMHFRAMRKVAA